MERTLVAQLTGKAANILLLNEQGISLTPAATARRRSEIGNLSTRRDACEETHRHIFLLSKEASARFPSGDEYYRILKRLVFLTHAPPPHVRVCKRNRHSARNFSSHLDKDMEGHGNADEHKRIVDLMLAISGAKNAGEQVTLTDYFPEDMPRIELDLDENSTLIGRSRAPLQSLYESAPRREEIYTTPRALEKDWQRCARASFCLRLLLTLERVLRSKFLGEAKGQRRARKIGRTTADSIPGARRYRSSDGYEVLSGRGRAINDHLTFRVARPYDLWLHAADYPGSHVVVRTLRAQTSRIAPSSRPPS